MKRITGAQAAREKGISLAEFGAALNAIYVLEISGHVPSKKNMLRRSKNGGMFHDAVIAAEMCALEISAISERNRAGFTPLFHPEMAIRFYVRDRRGDRDNKLTTILDVLQRAGVIFNDNIAHGNGTLTVLPAIVDENERTVIYITGHQPKIVRAAKRKVNAKTK